MTLTDKRKVIEVLLCASGDGQAPPIYSAGLNVLGTQALANRVLDIKCRWVNAAEMVANGFRYHEIAAEAAYRLIESSPTLRREWFGRP